MRSLAQLLLTILLNAFWQIAVITLFAACCSWLLRGTAARHRHSVWVASIVISLCLPVATSLNAMKSLRPVSRNANTSELVIPATPVSSLDEIDLPLKTVSVETPAHVSGRPGRGRLGGSIHLDRNLSFALIAIYVLFLLGRGLMLLRAWWRTREIVRRAYATPLGQRAANLVARCQTAIGVTNVRIVCSKSIPVPITAGLFKPLVILPEQLLREADDEVLLSAIGHELVHVSRRDYALNLLYELIYLPISFHPAAALLRRRIRQTRELCCDELVATRLLAPEVYARSLVRLVGSVPLGRRLATDTTIGIADADILEVRIMSLLKTSKLSTSRKTLLLVAACLLLAAPCVAATAFALKFNIDNPVPVIGQGQGQDQEAARKAARNADRAREELQRAHEELQSKERELTERIRKNPNPQGEELETLRRLENELQEASGKLREEQILHLKETSAEMQHLRERLGQLATASPADEAAMREAKERIEQLQRSFPESEARSKELREQLALLERQIPSAEQRAEYERTMERAKEEFAWQQAMTQEQREKLEEKLKRREEVTREVEKQYREVIEKAETEGWHLKTTKDKEYQELIRKDGDKQVRKEREKADREGRVQEQAELAQLATVSMDQAIQMAVSQHPGKVLSCSLGRQKGGQPYYRLVIIGGGDKHTATYVWVSATDGRIIKTEHE